VRTLIILLLLCGTCMAAPLSRNYPCVQGHEQAATDKLQAYIKRAIVRFFRSRRIAIDPSTLQVNVNLTIQTTADSRPYAAFTGSAGGFAANVGAGAPPTPIPGATGAPGAPKTPGAGKSPPGGAVAANPLGGLNAYAGGGLGLGSTPAATVNAKDGTRFEVLFSSGSDLQNAGEYRILASQRDFTREGNPIGGHCRLRLFVSGDFDATRSLSVINAGSGHALGVIPLPAQIWVY